MDQELYSINQARMLMGGISRGTLYGLLRSGVLISVPIGRRRFITAEAIKSFIANAAERDAEGCRLIASGRISRLRLKMRPSVTSGSG